MSLAGWCAIALIVLLPGNLLAQGPLKTLGQDLQNIIAPRHLGIAAAGLGLAWLVSPLDDDINDRIDGNFLSKTTKSSTRQYGRSIYVVPASFALWGLAKAAGHRPSQTLFSDVGRAVLFAELLIQPTKRLVGRRRPDGSDKRSFPSGHTGSSFAIARTLQRQYGHRVGLPLYAVGSVVALNRMERNVHHLSDTVAGAVFGYIAGSSIHLAAPGRLALAPQRLGPTWTLEARLHL